MVAPTTTEAFLNLVKQSGLVELPRLQEYLKERLESGGIPASARRIAQDMLSDGLLTKFQAEQILMGHYRKFEVAGKYRLMDRVGEGGAAAVYLCEHLILKRPVALKILPSWKTKSPEIVSRFLREARAAARVDHPNIVRVHDVEASDQNYFLVTEFVDGPNLEALVEATGPLSPARAARYIHDAALALQHAHEVGIVHRDVKPSNLLVDQLGHVKLLDLGLVKLTQSDDGLTQALEGKAVLGTIDFQAPEQAVDSSDVDIRADIYSLGASFFFLLTGQVVFPEGTVAQKLSWHQRRTPPPLREIRPDIPERMARIVARMLAKDPRGRFQEPRQIAEALEPWAREPAQSLEEYELPKLSRASRTFLANWASRGKSATTPGLVPARRPTPQQIPVSDRPSKQPSPRSPRSRWPAGTAVLGIGLFVAGFTLASWLARRGEQVEPVTIAPNAVIPTSWSQQDEPRSSGETAQAPIDPEAESVSDGEIRGDTAATVAIRLISAGRAPRPLPSVQAALDRAGTGDRIEVQGTLLRESIDWVGRPGVTLVSANPDRTLVAWEPVAKAGEDRCCLRVEGTEDVTIRGFLMEGGGNTSTLVRIVGPCPNLLLENLEFRGATRPLALRATSGTVDRPQILRGLRFLRAGDSSIVLEAGVQDPDAPSGPIRVDLCRFEGPSPAAIRLDAPTVSVEVSRCRFQGLDDGLLYPEEAARASLDLALRGNTFCDVRRGLHFERTPPPDGQLVVENNLFVRTKALAYTDNLALQPAWAPRPSAWIWTGEGDPGSATVPTGERPFRKAFLLPEVPERAILEAAADDSFEAWINGEPAGRSQSDHFDQRVLAFDVTRLLRAGKNVLAILATNRADPLRPGEYGTTAGLMARLTCASIPDFLTITTDSTWKTTLSAPSEGWLLPSFDDTGWVPARPCGERKGLAVTWPWACTIWDSLVEDQLRAPSSPFQADGAGNVRDDSSWEGYPHLRSIRATIRDKTLPRLPLDDGRFLRYSRRDPLYRAGMNGLPVGLPQP
ncbi:MAG: protein kinase [Isosphaeraceae bacterium]